MRQQILKLLENNRTTNVWSVQIDGKYVGCHSSESAATVIEQAAKKAQTVRILTYQTV